MSEYLIVIDDAGANFSAHAPDVPGCVATGPTVDDTVANMRAALAFHFEGLRAEGLPVPPPASRGAVVEVG
ncbi:MAG TPA: type II toxin-antitoxin system HicB family antitoxin [Solirubrobacteraceae bacterium]